MSCLLFLGALVQDCNDFPLEEIQHDAQASCKPPMQICRELTWPCPGRTAHSAGHGHGQASRPRPAATAAGHGHGQPGPNAELKKEQRKKKEEEEEEEEETAQKEQQQQQWKKAAES